MKNINLKVSLWIILIIALIVFFINYFMYEKPLQLLSYIFNSLNESVSIIAITAYIFDKYLWKCKMFKKWLVLIPDLNGSWEGLIQSDWVNHDTKEKCKLIEIVSSIKQSLSHISCVMRTGEMKSNSTTSVFRLDTDNQILELSCVYRSEPNQNVRKRSQIHYGIIVFDIVELKNDEIKLKGNYWTDRKTVGTVELRRK
ncbi:MAG: hypothetical protein LE178_01280 [Endomicrobium sp.]|nr:hypothetical protein [Endomicrobium sp.]